VAPDGRSVFVGFSDGVVRVLWRGNAVAPGGEKVPFAGQWAREQVFKPHNGAVTALAFSPDGAFFATAGRDGKVFLFADPSAAAGPSPHGLPAGAGAARPTSAGGARGTRQFDPVGFVLAQRDAPPSQALPPAFATSLCFRPDGGALLLSASDGNVGQVDLSPLTRPTSSRAAVGEEGGGAGGEGGAAAGEGGGEGGGVAAAGDTTDSFALNLPTAWHAMKRPKADKKPLAVAAAAGGEAAGGAASEGSGPAAGSDGAAGGAGGGAGSVVAEEEAEEEALPLPPALQCAYVRNRSGLPAPAQPGATRCAHATALRCAATLFL
jgi:hypothetical protein